MITRREAIKNTAVVAVASALGLVASSGPALAAPLNPQRIAGGAFPFPIYINGTGSSQSMARGIYVDQTQYTQVAAGLTRTLLGVGQ